MSFPFIFQSSSFCRGTLCFAVSQSCALEPVKVVSMSKQRVDACREQGAGEPPLVSWPGWAF